MQRTIKEQYLDDTNQGEWEKQDAQNDGKDDKESGAATRPAPALRVLVLGAHTGDGARGSSCRYGNKKKRV